MPIKITGVVKALQRKYGSLKQGIPVDGVMHGCLSLSLKAVTFRNLGSDQSG